MLLTLPLLAAPSISLLAQAPAPGVTLANTEQRPALFQRIAAASPARLDNNREVLAAFDRLKASSAKVRLDISKGDDFRLPREEGPVAALAGC